jgi:hypothetical protein
LGESARREGRQSGSEYKPMGEPQTTSHGFPSVQDNQFDFDNPGVTTFTAPSDLACMTEKITFSRGQRQLFANKQ